MKEDITKIINTIKILGIDMIDNAKSGNPGITLGAAPIMYTLYANHININPSDPIPKCLSLTNFESSLLFSIFWFIASI